MNINSIHTKFKFLVTLPKGQQFVSVTEPSIAAHTPMGTLIATDVGGEVEYVGSLPAPVNLDIAVISAIDHFENVPAEFKFIAIDDDGDKFAYMDLPTWENSSSSWGTSKNVIRTGMCKTTLDEAKNSLLMREVFAPIAEYRKTNDKLREELEGSHSTNEDLRNNLTLAQQTIAQLHIKINNPIPTTLERDLAVARRSVAGLSEKVAFQQASLAINHGEIDRLRSEIEKLQTASAIWAYAADHLNIMRNNLKIAVEEAQRVTLAELEASLQASQSQFKQCKFTLDVSNRDLKKYIVENEQQATRIKELETTLRSVSASELGQQNIDLKCRVESLNDDCAQYAATNTELQAKINVLQVNSENVIRVRDLYLRTLNSARAALK